MNGLSKWVVAIWFTLGIVILSLTIFDFTCNGISLRDNRATTDSILSILVTFLVAWQIWQTIASREDLQEARGVVEKLKAVEKKVDEIAPLTDAHLHYSLATAMQVKGLDIAEVRSDKFEDEERSKMSQRAMFTCLAFSQYLSTLKLYSDIESRAKEYIAVCLQSIDNMAMRMRGNYDLVTKGLINAMISDIDSTLIQCGKILNKEQVSTLKDLKQELTHNLPNGIDAGAALAEKRKQRETKAAAPKADTP